MTITDLPYNKLWDDQNSVSFSKHEYTISNHQIIPTDRSKMTNKTVDIRRLRTRGDRSDSQHYKKSSVMLPMNVDHSRIDVKSQIGYDQVVIG